MIKTEDFKFDYETPKILSVVKSIPSNWVYITADLHAPREMVDAGKVAPGVIWQISGKTMEESSRFYSHNHFSLERCGRGKEFCPYSLESGGHEESVITGGLKPCGVRMFRAGQLTSEQDLERLKSLLSDLVNQGYVVEELMAAGEIRQRIDRENIWEEDHSLGLMSYSMPDPKRADIKLSWSEEATRGKEDIEAILSQLKSAGITHLVSLSK